MPNTYDGTPCKNCSGTLRYFMMRDGVSRRTGQCVACGIQRARAQMAVRDRSQEPARRRNKNYKDNSKPKSDRVRLGVRDPTAGGAFADSIRHLLRAGHA